jgi:hypothetical protein
VPLASSAASGGTARPKYFSSSEKPSSTSGAECAREPEQGFAMFDAARDAGRVLEVRHRVDQGRARRGERAGERRQIHAVFLDRDADGARTVPRQQRQQARIAGVFDADGVAGADPAAQQKIQSVLDAVAEQDLVARTWCAEARHPRRDPGAQRRVAARVSIVEQRASFLPERRVERAAQRVERCEARIGCEGTKIDVAGVHRPGKRRAGGGRRLAPSGPGEGLAHRRSPADPAREMAAGEQLAIGAADRAAVDAQPGGQAARRGQVLARGERTGLDSRRDLLSDLAVERLGRVRV